jgi:hypothetical protein
MSLLYSLRRAGTIKADATRALDEMTTTLPGGSNVIVDKIECLHHDNGTSVCRNLRLLAGVEGSGPSTTLIDVAATGTPTPWATVKGIESALLPTSVEYTTLTATGDDEGSALGALGQRSVVTATLAVGFALALI